MKKVLILLLVISLFLIEGCTIIGYAAGSGIHIVDSHRIEEIESTKKDSWLTITFKDNEVLKGQFRSCVNDTLYIAYKITDFHTPTSNYQIYSISHDIIIYKIPVNRIHELQIRKGDYRGVGGLIGCIIDILIIVNIINNIEIKPNMSGAFSNGSIF